MRLFIIAMWILGVVGCGNTDNTTPTKDGTVVTPQSPNTQIKEKQPPSIPVI